MENNLQIFESNDFGQLRTIDDDNGKVMFVASDVAKMLGYNRPNDAVNAHCRYTVKCRIPHPQGKGTLEVNVIPEGDLYRLITHSKLPAAEKFESWVFDEVLPTIRKTGSYKTPKQSSDREKAMLKNAQARSAKLWLEIAKNTGIQTYKDVCNAYAAKELAGEDVLPLPKVQEKSYSATDIGKMLGVSKAKIGALANKNNMKCDEYGSWFHDKSPYSGKEVETFRYNGKAIEKFRSLLKGGAQA